MSAARGPHAAPAGSACESRAAHLLQRLAADDGGGRLGWPPPPSPAITAATSSAGVRLRPTANTRPSISTSITIASHR